MFDGDGSGVRGLWTRFELVHAVTYFAEESISAARQAGLRGFWMGYFGFRASPLGEASAVQVGEAFYNFAPSMVERSIPDAWRFSTPDALLEARAESAGRALRRLFPAIAALAMNVNGVLRDAVECPKPSSEFPLFEANRALPRRDDVVEELWQLCTTLREQRGDGHVAALRDSRIGGCEAHVLFAAEQGVDEAVLRDNRGFSSDVWAASAASLIERGLLDAQGALTKRGREVRSTVEARTDAHANEPWTSAPPRALAELVSSFDPIAKVITADGPIPFPNPMGLPRLSL